MNHVLDCCVQRESQYALKKCTSAAAKEVFIRVLERKNTVQMEIPNVEYENGYRDKRKLNFLMKKGKKPKLTCIVQIMKNG